MTDTDELVKWLRIMGNPRSIEAADAIESLQSELKRRFDDYEEGTKTQHKLYLSARTRIAELEAQLAARGEAVVEFCARRLSPEGTREMWGFTLTDKPIPRGTKLFTHPAPAVPAGSITISKELRDFLMGAESFDGHWFGDSVDGRRFWWRKYLEAAAPKGE